MTHGAFGFLVAGLVPGVAILVAFTLVIYRETRRTLALDRRLEVPRRLAMAAGLWPERRTRRHTGRGRYSWVRAVGLALLGAGSMAAPVRAAERARLARLIRQAGYGHRDALSFYLCAKMFAAIAAAAAAGWWTLGQDAIAQQSYIAAVTAVAGFVAGGIVPEYGLRFLVARRSQRMASVLPDALDLMVMCLESGLTFERSLTTVAEELRLLEPHLAGELRLMEAELRHGSNRRTVLEDFYQRIDVEGLRDLAMTLIQSERYGTPLTQSMKNITVNERIQRAARIEAQAERLPVLMTLPMMLFVVPGTVALVAGPAFLTAFDALGRIAEG